MHHYLENSYLVYKCTNSSFKCHTNSSRINLWISKDIDETEKVTGAGNSQIEWPTVVNNGRMYVKSNGGYFKLPTVSFDSNVTNIYMVYKLDPIASNRDDTFTVLNALFGIRMIQIRRIWHLF